VRGRVASVLAAAFLRFPDRTAIEPHEESGAASVSTVDRVRIAPFADISSATCLVQISDNEGAQQIVDALAGSTEHRVSVPSATIPFRAVERARRTTKRPDPFPNRAFALPINSLTESG
jgi:hypothetical protein